MQFNLSTGVLVIGLIGASSVTARDNVQIAGSSTVLPYASIVAEAFGENFDFPSPVVESGGSSGGLKRFCQGLGATTIDIANSSRKIKDKEMKACAESGVSEIIEVRIGFDGIVFASDINGASFAFEPQDWYRALAAQIPQDGKLVPNNAVTWSDVNADLPAQEIITFIPGTKHGTREVFEEKVILAGCEQSGAFDAIKSINGGDEHAAEAKCMSIRTDGRSIDIDGDYTETLASVDSNKNGIGVFGLSFYTQNTEKLQIATMSGITPSVETISSGDYPVSRPLYFYVKKAHLDAIAGLKEYIEFFMLDEVAGPDGLLAEYGLIADPDIAQTQENIAMEKAM